MKLWRAQAVELGPVHVLKRVTRVKGPVTLRWSFGSLLTALLSSVCIFAYVSRQSSMPRHFYHSASRQMCFRPWAMRGSMCLSLNKDWYSVKTGFVFEWEHHTDRILSAGLCSAPSHTKSLFTNTEHTNWTLNADCCFSDDHGFSPLHWACREGRSAVVDMLIMRGARINVMNRGDDTPLHLAASHGHRDIVAKVNAEA